MELKEELPGETGDGELWWLRYYFGLWMVGNSYATDNLLFKKIPETYVLAADKVFPFLSELIFTTSFYNVSE